MKKTRITLAEENAYSLSGMAEGAIASVKVATQDAPDCEAILIGIVVSKENNPDPKALICSNKANNLYLKHLDGTDEDKSVTIDVPVLDDFENGIWFRGVAFFFSKEKGVNVVYSSEYRHFCKEQ